MKYYIMHRPEWDDINTIYKQYGLHIWSDHIGPFDSIEAAKAYITKHEIKFGYIQRIISPE